jgi:tetratricopeptide (TPR) repeat protein
MKTDHLIRPVVSAVLLWTCLADAAETESSSASERFKAVRDELLKNPPAEGAAVQEKLLYFAKLANAEARLRDYQQAETHARQLVELDPNGDQSHDTLSVCLGKQGKFDEAIAEAEKAISLKPGDTMQQNIMLAEWEWASGKKEAAQKRIAEIPVPQGRVNQRRYYDSTASFYATSGDEEKLKEALRIANAADDDGSEADLLSCDNVFDPYREKDWFIKLLDESNRDAKARRNAHE